MVTLSDAWQAGQLHLHNHRGCELFMQEAVVRIHGFAPCWLMLALRLGRDLAGVLGGDATLSLLLEPLNKVGQGDDFDWRTAEASLFCIRCEPPSEGTACKLKKAQAAPGCTR